MGLPTLRDLAKFGRVANIALFMGLLLFAIGAETGGLSISNERLMFGAVLVSFSFVWSYGGRAVSNRISYGQRTLHLINWPSVFGLLIFVAAEVILLFNLINVGAQVQSKEPAKPSLKETISWMENFSASHGFLAVGRDMIRFNSLSAVKECTVSVDAHFPRASGPSQPKSLIITVLLGDFDPNSVREITDKDEGSYQVLVERSDARFLTEETEEMADGKKAKVYLAEVYLFFDSEESAKRFSRALAYSVGLCGGQPSAF